MSTPSYALSDGLSSDDPQPHQPQLSLLNSATDPFPFSSTSQVQYQGSAATLPSYHSMLAQYQTGMGQFNFNNNNGAYMHPQMQVMPQEVIHRLQTELVSITAERDVLKTEKDTIQRLYDGLLASMSPNASSAPSSASPHSSSSSPLPYDSVDPAKHEAIAFWTWNDYKIKRNEPGSKVKARGPHGYLEMEDGTFPDKSTLDSLRKELKRLWKEWGQSKDKKISCPLKYEQLSRSQHTDYIQNVVALFPFMGLCRGDWKIDKLSSYDYPSWRSQWLDNSGNLKHSSDRSQSRRPGVKKQEDDEAVVPSGGTKRSASVDSESGKALPLKRRRVNSPRSTPADDEDLDGAGSRPETPIADDASEADALDMVPRSPSPERPIAPARPRSARTTVAASKGKGLATELPVKPASEAKRPESRRPFLPLKPTSGLAKEALKNKVPKPTQKSQGASVSQETQDTSAEEKTSPPAPAGSDISTPSAVATDDSPAIEPAKATQDSPASNAFKPTNKKIGRNLCAYRWLNDASIDPGERTSERFDAYWKKLAPAQRKSYDEESKRLKLESVWMPDNEAVREGTIY